VELDALLSYPKFTMNTKKSSSQTSEKSEGKGSQNIQVLEVMHFRRCHHCEAVNVAQGSALLSCQSCGKHFAPFYFFDESSMDALDEAGIFKSTLREAKTIQPIWGISFYWTDVASIGDTKEELQIKDLHESQLRRDQKNIKKQSRRQTGNGPG
jgi:hypothetical protein